MPDDNKGKQPKKKSKVARKKNGQLLPGVVLNPNGRPPGAKSSFEMFRNDFLSVYEKNGGVKWLLEWSKTNQTEFMKLTRSFLPKEIKLEAPQLEAFIDALVPMIREQQKFTVIDVTAEKGNGETHCQELQLPPPTIVQSENSRLNS